MSKEVSNCELPEQFFVLDDFYNNLHNFAKQVSVVAKKKNDDKLKNVLQIAMHRINHYYPFLISCLAHFYTHNEIVNKQDFDMLLNNMLNVLAMDRNFLRCLLDDRRSLVGGRNEDVAALIERDRSYAFKEVTRHILQYNFLLHHSFEAEYKM